MNIYIPYTRLPSAYQEVEYIASTSGGGQYINTGMANVSINTKVEYSFAPMADNNLILFMDNGWNSSGFGTGMTYYYYGAYDSSGTFPSCSVGTQTTIILAKDGCYKDGANKRVPTASSISPSGNVYLFVYRRNNTNDSYKYCKLYSYKRWESGTLVQDLVPCYRKSDSVIGVYDVVNNQFYTNSGTGTFTKGNDVYVNTLKNIYIGEYKGFVPGANTVLYLPLNGDVVDYSKYNRSFTVYGASASVGTPIFDTISNGKKVSKFVATGGTSSNRFMFTNDLTDIPTSGDITVSYWIRWNGQYTSGYQTAIAYRSDTNTAVFRWMAGLTNTKYIMFHGNSAKTSSLSPTTGTRYNIINVVNNGQLSIYLNGNTSSQIYSGAFSYGGGNPSRFCIGAFWADAQGTRRDEAFNGNLGDIIIENRIWTAQEISDYYNQTKSNYGL